MVSIEGAVGLAIEGSTWHPHNFTVRLVTVVPVLTSVNFMVLETAMELPIDLYISYIYNNTWYIQQPEFLLIDFIH